MSLGLKLDKKKEYIQGNWAIASTRPPAKVTISFPKSSAAQMKWRVGPGDFVKTGDVIAEPLHESAGHLHSSVTGTVQRLLEVPHFSGATVPAVEILTSLREEWKEFEKIETHGQRELGTKTLLAIFSRCGLQTLDENEEFLHARIFREKISAKGALILNACESEPYITSQTCLLLSHTLEVLKGAEYLRQALGAGRMIMVCESDAEEVVEIIRSKIYFLKWKHLEIVTAGKLFPQDDARLLKRLVQSKYGLSFEETAVYPASVAYPIYEAVTRGKPFIEKALTLAGECMAESRNVWARLGTLSEDLFRMGKGILREPGKRLAGGPMRGHVLSEGAVPLSGGISALLALPKEMTERGETGSCIRCGHCLEVCPSHLSPVLITQAAEHQEWDVCEKENVRDCIECGNCTYVCPSNLPLEAWLHEAKSKMNTEDFKPFADNLNDSSNVRETQLI